MSAYVCSDAQFKALAIFAVRKDDCGRIHVDPSYVDGARDVAGKTSSIIATRYAAMLLAENVRSVRHRYPDDDGNYDEVRVSAAEVLNTGELSPVVILKQCANLDYQSCETNDWETTNAFKLLQRIKYAAIRNLPGYDEAPWGLDKLPMAAPKETNGSSYTSGDFLRSFGKGVG